MISIEDEKYNRELFKKIYDVVDNAEYYTIKDKYPIYNEQSICKRWEDMFEDIAYEVKYLLRDQAEVFGGGETGKAEDCNTAFKSLRKALDIIIEENEKIIEEDRDI